MNFLSHPRRARSLGYVHGMNANLAETLETYARGIIRGIHPIDSDQSEAVLRALNNWGWDDDLELYLPFDETSGQTAFDLSGNGNTGTATGTTIVDGVFGKARSFIGTVADYVSASATNFITAPPLTFEAWIYPDVRDQMTIFSKGNLNNEPSYAFLTQANGKLRFFAYSTGFGTSDSTALYNASEWTHVAVTVDASWNCLFYINGIAGGGSQVAGSTAFVNTDALTMGKLSYCDAWFCDGLLDEMRQYSRVLTADEIYLHYLAGALKLGLI